MEAVTVMVDAWLRVGVPVLQPVEVTLGLDEAEECAEELAMAEAVAAPVADSAPLRLFEGLGVAVMEVDVEADALVEEEGVSREELEKAPVVEGVAERDLGPVRVADSEAEVVSAPEGVSNGVRVSWSCRDAEEEADAEYDATAVSVCDTVVLMLREGLTDAEGDSEGEGEAVASEEMVAHAEDDAVWLSVRVTVTDAEKDDPMVSVPVDESLLASVGDTDGDWEVRRERVDCAETDAAPEVVTVKVAEEQEDAENVEDTELVPVTVEVTVKVGGAVGVSAAVPVAAVVAVTVGVTMAV